MKFQVQVDFVDFQVQVDFVDIVGYEVVVGKDQVWDRKVEVGLVFPDTEVVGWVWRGRLAVLVVVYRLG